MSSYDCIVVGSGHAGSCAALSAIDNGCKRVLIIDKCSEEWVGGNGYFTAGAHRTVHSGLFDLQDLVVNASPDVIEKIDMDPYTHDDFVGDIMRLSDGRSNPELVEAVVSESRDAIQWLYESVKVPFTFSFNRQAYVVNGRQKFWGGMVLSVQDGGKGLIHAHQKALKEAGVELWFETAATTLLTSPDGAIRGLMVNKNGQHSELETKSVILACGGFESSKELRAKHLGPQWANARVRGTPYNTGDAFSFTSSVSAKLTPDWSASLCHCTCWDYDAPLDSGDRVLTNQYTKSGYPLGLMFNSLGKRFVDEGEDLRNYTYAKFGRAILYQPGGMAYQIWDAKGGDLLRAEEYADDVVEKVQADSLEELGEKLAKGKGLEDREQFMRTVTEYNNAVKLHREEHQDLQFNPAVKDGLSTQSSSVRLEIPKSNWALTIDESPFLAVRVASGITFTFGGLAINPETANVLREDGSDIKGLFATGEVIGGLFYRNYPGGSGLTAGAVFGRKAGMGAAKL